MFVGRKISCCIGLVSLPYAGFTTYKHILFIILSWLHQEFYHFITFYKFRSMTDLHTQLFIIPFNTVHPEDGRRRRPKYVGVVNK